MQTLAQLLAGELTGATSVKISENLTEFPEKLLELADTLEILDLNGNHLSRLPESFQRLKNLRILFLSENDFTEFPAILGSCLKLEMIGFKANQIKTIPENAFPPNLRWLILTDNQIAKLPASIGNCTRMQKLMLAGNKLSELPAELANCRNLELLRISANNLNALPDWLLTLPKLAWLAFAGNPFANQNGSNSEIPEISWSDLDLAEKLGEGASGHIFKAMLRLKEGNNSPVAVKLFKGEVTSDGYPSDEMAATIAAGRHPNIVPVKARISMHPEQKQGLIFELIPAGYKNLGGPPSFATCTRDVFPNGMVFTLKTIEIIATGIAAAVKHLHSNGILHGDLYAHNILTSKDAAPLLSDFGAATSFRKLKTGQQANLKKIESRAFGCLLEDLLNLLEPSEQSSEKAIAFNRLKNSCFQENLMERPDFVEICDQLSEINAALA